MREKKQRDQNLIWEDVLSGAQGQLLNIARALISNFEVMCIHHPTNGLGDQAARKAMQAMQPFVELKGVEQDPDQFNTRRPRTCFITHCAEDMPEQADVVVKVSL